MSNEVAKKETSEVAPQNMAGSMMQVISNAAANPAVDVVKMEKLLDMQERIINKESEMKFNTAVAEMQNSLPTISKNGQIVVNNVIRSTYATFDDILTTVKPVMKEYGLAMTFKIDTSADAIKVTGILMHREGHREETTMTLPLDNSGSKNSVQAMGSSISYGKRYIVCAMLNLATGDDNDGNSEPISTDQVMTLAKKLNDLPGIEKQVLMHAGVDAIHLIPASMFDMIISRLDETVVSDE